MDTFAAGLASEPLFAASQSTIVEPLSTFVDNVNVPENVDTSPPLQNIVAVPIVALLAAALVLPPIVTSEVGPPSGFPVPLPPGPAARTGEATGIATAAKTIPTTMSQERRRAIRPRRREISIMGVSPSVRRAPRMK